MCRPLGLTQHSPEPLPWKRRPLTDCAQAERWGCRAALQKAGNFGCRCAVAGWSGLPGRSPRLTPHGGCRPDSSVALLVTGCGSSAALERCVCQVLDPLFLRLAELELPLPEVRDLCSPPLRLLPPLGKGPAFGFGAGGIQQGMSQHQPRRRKQTASMGEAMALIRFEAETQN